MLHVCACLHSRLHLFRSIESPTNATMHLSSQSAITNAHNSTNTNTVMTSAALSQIALLHDDTDASAFPVGVFDTEHQQVRSDTHKMSCLIVFVG
jgi:hypothetical protein